MRLNKPVRNPMYTHEGGKAEQATIIEQLRRTLMCCYLWENNFYEDGVSVADRLVSLAMRVRPTDLAALIVEARTVHGLRHAPLLLLSVLCETGSGSSLVSDTFRATISRPDDMTEFMAIHQKRCNKPIKKCLSVQARKGLAKAFTKFSPYQLAKYNRDGAYKLRDVLFLSHAKPDTPKQDATWKQLISNTLPVPDTWEVALSTSTDPKGVTWRRLLTEEKLGDLAFLRNLRNMVQADPGLIPLLRQEILRRAERGFKLIEPFRFIAAARACMELEPELNQCIKSVNLGMGKVCVLVDVSGSMEDKLSSKSDLTRMDAACGLAVCIEADSVFSFSSALVQVPVRPGMSGVDAIQKSQHHGGTYLTKAVSEVLSKKYTALDTLIVITDEQHNGGSLADLSTSEVRGIVINVATNKNGIGYSRGWTHIDGFSEGVIKYLKNMNK